MRLLVNALYEPVWSGVDFVCVLTGCAAGLMAKFGGLSLGQGMLYGLLGYLTPFLILKVPYWIWKMSKRKTKKVPR